MDLSLCAFGDQKWKAAPALLLHNYFVSYLQEHSDNNSMS